MLSNHPLVLAGALALAVASPALAGDRGPESPGRDDVDYGDAPSAAPWLGTIPAQAQDDSRMQPPEARAGTESQSGATKPEPGYDFTTMRPTGPDPER